MSDHKMCNITTAHLGHDFKAPPSRPGDDRHRITYSCPGVPHRPADDVPPGPCWHDSGIGWAGQEGPTVHCELLAGHLGAHTATRPGGGESVWTETACCPSGRHGVAGLSEADFVPAEFVCSGCRFCTPGETR